VFKLEHVTCIYAAALFHTPAPSRARPIRGTQDREWYGMKRKEETRGRRGQGKAEEER
jgi:hypothetical protein